MVTFLLAILGLLLVIFLFVFLRDIWAHRETLNQESGSYLVSGIIGFVVDALDAMGIGSFAPSTMLLGMFKQMDDDREMPGTLNVGHTVPVIIEAFIFIKVVEVAPLTLLTLIACAMLGGFIGSKFVTKLPEKKVQIFVGIALILTAFLMAAKQLGYLEMLGSGNTATSLDMGKLIIGGVGHFIFGALMTIGVGLYAPSMALVYMLGLNPLIAFPIMMGSCAGQMPIASLNFVKEGKYNRKVSLMFTIFGSIGVFIATQFITGMDMNMLTWVIIAVIIYTGFMYIRKSKVNEA